MDVLVSDIGMPAEDGYTLIRKLRQNGNRVPTLALTAFARGEDRERAFAEGFQRHIAKPVQPSLFTVLIAQSAGCETACE